MKAMPEPRTPEASSGMDAVLKRLLRVAREREVETKNCMDNLLAEATDTGKLAVPCRNHPPRHHSLDLKQSAIETQAKGYPVFKYQLCELCELQRGSEWMIKAGVPLKLICESIDSWKPQYPSHVAVLQAVNQFVTERRGFLVLSGGVGTGKTHLGVGIMRAMRCGRMFTQGGFLAALRRTYNTERVEDPVDACKRAKLLIFDEVGVSTGGRDEMPAIYEVMNHRYGANLPTVLTTNLPISELPEVLGDRIVDRIRESDMMVAIAGQSMRGKNR